MRGIEGGRSDYPSTETAFRDEAAAFRATLAALRQHNAAMHQGLGGLPAFDFLSWKDFP